MGRQRYSWNRAAFPFDSTSIVPVHDHVTEKTPNTRNANGPRTQPKRDLRFVACIHTAGLTVTDTRHPRRTRSRRPVRLSYTAAQRTEEPRIASTQKHMAKNLSVRGPPAY